MLGDKYSIILVIITYFFNINQFYAPYHIYFNKNFFFYTQLYSFMWVKSTECLLRLNHVIKLVNLLFSESCCYISTSIIIYNVDVALAADVFTKSSILSHVRFSDGLRVCILLSKTDTGKLCAYYLTIQLFLINCFYAKTCRNGETCT